MSGDRLDHSGGAGLGLTIARSIVTAHGGTIDAEARPSGGLHVSVALPDGEPACAQQGAPGGGEPGAVAVAVAVAPVLICLNSHRRGAVVSRLPIRSSPRALERGCEPADSEP